MEYYQAIQNRTAQTVAVIDQYIPGFKVGAALGQIVTDATSPAPSACGAFSKAERMACTCW